MRSVACTFVVSLVSVALARVQPDPGETSAYLLRLEHKRPADDRCVLVRGDGRYHFEQSTRERTIIFEGTIADADLQRLFHWVGEDELMHLTPDKIVPPIFYGPRDEFLVSVNRPDHWQNLSFPARATWQPYTQSVAPLVQWLDELRKAKGHVKLREEQGRTFCTPPHMPELTTRAEEARQQAVEPFVIVVHTTTFKGRNGEQRCAVVYPDGRYHRETKSQRSGSNEVVTAVYEGTVPTDQLQALGNILSVPAIRKRPEMYHPLRSFSTDGEITDLTLSVGGKTRTLLFWKYDPLFDVHGNWHVDENGAKAVEPLSQWLKSNVDDPSITPLASANLSDCIPPHRP